MAPLTDLKTVVDSQIKEWHFHIYFHQKNAEEYKAALELRDAVLRLRRDGAFIAVPLATVNTDAHGPHPVGSYEIWVPSESFAEVYSYLCMNRGELSVLVHPLTRDQVIDHKTRHAWIGPSYPLDVSRLPIRSEDVPLQYPDLKLGYSTVATELTLEERRAKGLALEQMLLNEKEAAGAPSD